VPWIDREWVSRVSGRPCDGDGRVSQVPGEPVGSFARFSDPGVTRHADGTQGRSCPARPPRLTKTRAHHEEISGLNRTAFDRAVYASPWRLPATAPDALPAAGPALRDGIGDPQGSDKRFHVSGDPPFPSFLGARSNFVSCFGEPRVGATGPPSRFSPPTPVFPSVQVSDRRQDSFGRPPGSLTVRFSGVGRHLTDQARRILLGSARRSFRLPVGVRGCIRPQRRS
jgi:hypothetical protein